nr:zinc finger CCCH domain-containing protein 13-like [Salvelinus alpinus]
MHFGVRHIQLTLLLSAAVASVQVPEPHLSLSNERTSIERTYELTKYLEHQLREIKDTYLSYLGPPFSDPDFSPPRPNSTTLSLPSAATRLELWRGLENRARLTQNHRAYSVLLGAVRELARSTLCPYLQSSLLHFSTGLDSLLGSISSLMNTQGYALPPAGIETQYLQRDTGGDREAMGRRPSPLMSQSLYKAGVGAEVGPKRHPLGDQRGAGTTRGAVRGEKEESTRREMTERKREREKDRGRGRESRRAEVTRAVVRSVGSRQEERGDEDREEEEELERKGGKDRRGRRLLSVSEEGERTVKQGPLNSDARVTLSFSDRQTFPQQQLLNNNNNNNNYNHNNLYSYNFNYHPQNKDRAGGDSENRATEEEQYIIRESASLLSSSSSFHPQRRSPRSLFSPTLHSPLSLFYPFGTGPGEGHTLLSEPVPLSLRRGPPLLPPPPLPPLLSSSSLLSVQPALNDFSRKVEGFWVLRELQSWLWRSAKDFNRLKKRLRV